jgi:hypothetical protein
VASKRRQQQQYEYRQREPQNLQFNPFFYANGQGYSPVDFAKLVNLQQQFIGQIPGFPRHITQQQQRHYRNAAGTRRRFARTNGYHTPEFDGQEILPMHYGNGYADGYGPYNLPGQYNGYPATYYPPATYPHQIASLQHQHQPQIHQTTQQPTGNELLSPMYMQFQQMHINDQALEIQRQQHPQNEFQTFQPTLSMPAAVAQNQNQIQPQL